MIKIKRALISVTDKSGLAELAEGLSKFGVELISTGGTARAIRESGAEVIDVSQVTGFPEMLDGRVKTLHPKVHGGILARRDSEDHLAQLEQAGIQPIDLVAVNLYQFEKAVADPGCSLEDAIENIDIGGPHSDQGLGQKLGRGGHYRGPGRLQGLPGRDEGLGWLHQPAHPLAAGQKGLCHHRGLRRGHHRQPAPVGIGSRA